MVEVDVCECQKSASLQDIAITYLRDGNSGRAHDRTCDRRISTEHEGGSRHGLDGSCRGLRRNSDCRNVDSGDALYLVAGAAKIGGLSIATLERIITVSVPLWTNTNTRACETTLGVVFARSGDAHIGKSGYDLKEKKKQEPQTQRRVSTQHLEGQFECNV